MPYLFELIDKKKNNTQDEQKVQLIIVIIFRHITDSAKKYTFYVKTKKIDLRAGDDTNEIINKVLDSFFENYEREKNILRNGSNYVFDCVDLTYIQFHTIQLKRDSSHIPSPKWMSD